MKLEDIAKRKHVGLLAGGSGLTPMLQVRTALPQPDVGARAATSAARGSLASAASPAAAGQPSAQRARPNTKHTPPLQVVEEALRQKLPVQLSFIFANVSEADIIAKVGGPQRGCFLTA